MLWGKEEERCVEMDRDYAPRSLNHELDKERANGEGAPRAGQNPQRGEACAYGCGGDDGGPTPKELRVVSEELLHIREG